MGHFSCLDQRHSNFFNVPGGVLLGLVDVLSLKVGVCPEDFVDREPDCHKAYDGSYGDAQATDTGLVAHHFRIERNAWKSSHDAQFPP